MLFVFYHHVAMTFPNCRDLFKAFNPFAELFVGLAGFMVGLIYLYKPDDSFAIKRGWKILTTYFIVAIPVSMVDAIIYRTTDSPVIAGLKTLFFIHSSANIGILRFYGIIFLALPLIIALYRHNRRLLLYGSAILFLATTYIHQRFLFHIKSDFLQQAILVTLQWQFIFVLGLFLGNLFKLKLLLNRKLYRGILFLALLGFILDALLGFSSGGVKFPYTCEKYINLLWTAPIILTLGYYLYRYLKNGAIDNYIRVVGRNSLIAFAISEIVRETIIVPFLVLDANLRLWEQELMGILSAFLITQFTWIYERNLKGSTRIQDKLRILSFKAGLRSSTA
jgi:hypothetical protein